MKNLSDYIKNKQTALFDKYNAFFAFNLSQYDAAKKEGIKYVNRGAGLFHEAGKNKEFDTEYGQIIQEAIKQDLAENGKEAIIERELSNHECYYTGYTEYVVNKLKDYNISREEVLAEFRKNQSNHYDD